MSFETVNLFFACDERYLPFFAVTLTSVKSHRDENRRYAAYVLHTDIPLSVQKSLKESFEDAKFRLHFRDVGSEISHFVEKLHTRDYYSHATYYRLLIPELYPLMRKALYLDSDIILMDDVAKLFDTDISGMLAGAIADGFVNRVPVLRRYVENRVGVPAEMPYFNAGVLLMNLDEMRRISFGNLFIDLLTAVTFRVAQDQDYLNVICRGRVKFLSDAWNFMPFAERESAPSLVHFNLDNKPWQKDGIPYAADFWAYAQKTSYYDLLREKRDTYSEIDVLKAAQATEKLVMTAVEESEAVNENARIHARIARVMRKNGVWESAHCDVSHAVSRRCLSRQRFGALSWQREAAR